jgi:hypothetical protein
MASAKELRAKRGGWTGGRLLKGSDLPLKQYGVTVFFHDVIEAPENFGSPLVAKIDETQDAKWFAINVTNMGKLESEIGDDFTKWGGYEVTMKKVEVKNPQTGLPAIGLEITEVKKSKRKAEPVMMEDKPY